MIQRLARRGLVLEHDGELVLVQRLVGVGHVAVDHVEKAAVLHDHNAVARGVAPGREVGHALGDLLAGREVVVSAVLEINGDDVRKLQLRRLALLAGGVYLRVGERAQLTGVVGVLVGDEDLRDLLRLVAQRRERIHIGIDLPAHVNDGLLVHHLLRHLGRHAGVHQDHLIAGVDQVVLQAGAVLDRGVDPLRPLAAHGEELGHKAVFIELDCLDFHGYSSLVKIDRFIVTFYRRRKTNY